MSPNQKPPPPHKSYEWNEHWEYQLVKFLFCDIMHACYYKVEVGDKPHTLIQSFQTKGLCFPKMFNQQRHVVSLAACDRILAGIHHCHISHQRQLH